ncbi:LF2 [Auxenochlorella protothecoides x Auxenochlorella symbiontica]
MEAQAVLGSFVAGQEDYEVLEEIGQGTFSEVHRGRNRSTHQEVALKEMFLTEQKALPLHVERELQLLRAVSHPNILPLQGVYSKGFGITLVFPLCRTDLHRTMDAGPLPAPVAKAALKQLFEAVGALHDAGFAHRDLAPSNALLTDDGRVLLCDFGQARRLEDGHPQADGEAPEREGALTPVVGTRWYRAPELLFAARSYDHAVDCWSLGMIAAHALRGAPLCPGASDIDQICRVQAALGSIEEASGAPVADWADWGKLVFPPSPGQPWEALLPGTEPAARELCAGLLCYDPAQRWSVARALSSDYFDGAAAPADVAAHLAHLPL